MCVLLGDILHEPEVGPLGVDPIDAAWTQSVHQPRGITSIGELYKRCPSKVFVMNICDSGSLAMFTLKTSFQPLLLGGRGGGG
jgi:hypothetical protein